jgi:hypothetical protein
MKPITEIPTRELIADRAESAEDIKNCDTAQRLGFTHTSDGYPIGQRASVNRQTIQAIDAEIERRTAPDHFAAIDRMEQDGEKMAGDRFEA